MPIKEKLSYLLRSTMNAGQQKTCPYCKGKDLSVSDRKYLVTSLLRCSGCGLSHRHPKDDEAWLKNFYQSDYQIDVQMMTSMPDDEEIEKMKAESFPDLRSYHIYIDELFDKPVKIVDYGSSWGYNVFKLKNSGYDAVGYELSVPRGKFGTEKLGVTIHSETEHLPMDNDVVMSSHVIEHLSDIEAFIDLSKKHLKEEGVFMCLCPNGNEEYRKREPHTWHVNWGFIHPNYVDVHFAKHVFKDNPYLIMSADWHYDPSIIADWDGKSQVVHPKLDGKELFVIAKPNIKIN